MHKIILKQLHILAISINIVIVHTSEGNNEFQSYQIYI